MLAQWHDMVGFKIDAAVCHFESWLAAILALPICSAKDGASNLGISVKCKAVDLTLSRRRLPRLSQIELIYK